MMEQQIQIAVARADLILCTIGHVLPRVLRLLACVAVGYFAGRVVLKCPRKK